MRVTERANPETRLFDHLNFSDQIHALYRAERQMFGSKEWGPGLCDHVLHLQMGRIAQKLAGVASDANGRIFVGGAGTSGRLALFAQYYLPLIGVQAQTIGMMAGGSDAFFKAKEGVEDSAESGQSDLAAWGPSSGRQAYIGITCGLSAAYIAGQLAYACEAGFDCVVLLGFNPLDGASDRPIEALGTSLRGLLCNAELNIELINPILGPEPIAGSTRMKGGTASLILLDCLFRGGSVAQRMEAFAQIHEETFRQMESVLPQKVPLAVSCLEERHTLWYRGQGMALFAAVLDAAECPPTFGSKPDQVRVDHPEGLDSYLPFLEHPQQPFAQSSDWIFDIPHFSFKPNSQLKPELVELLATKWMLNAFSTQVFCALGKIYQNRMIDLRISNLKLLQRAIDLISLLGKVDQEAAQQALYEVIEISGQEPHRIVSQAVRKERVVPTALLMCLSGKSKAECLQLLHDTPRVYDALNHFMNA